MATRYDIIQMPVATTLDYLNAGNKANVIIANNVKFNPDGSYERINGHLGKITTPVSYSGFSTNIFNWNREVSGNDLVFSCQGKVFTLSADLTTATEIDSGFTGGARIGIANYGDLIHYGDGAYTNKSYDGTSVVNMSIVAPATACAGTSSNGAGTLENSGVYVYCYTYYNSTLGKESGISPTFTITLGGTDDTVSITDLAASSDTQVDYKRLYRTTNGGTAFLRVAEIANATTTYSDVTGDLSLGTSLTTQYYTHTQPCSIFIPQNNCMYMAGDVANPQRLYKSAIYNPEFLDTNETYFIDFDVRVTAVIPISTGLIVTEETSAWLVSGTDFDNATIQKIPGVFGCPCQSAVDFISGYPVFQSGSGIWMWDGSTVKELSKMISGRVSENVKAGTWDISWSALGFNPDTNELFWAMA